jgi:hypothetical protein
VAPLTKRSSAGYILNFLAWNQAETDVVWVAKKSLDRLAQDPQAYMVTFQVQLAAESPAREFAPFPP